MGWRLLVALPIALLMALPISGCEREMNDRSAPNGDPTMPVLRTPTPDAEERERLVAMARQDLSQRTGVPASEIQVVSVTRESWRDTSLGCPEPGKAYAQVLVPGYRIVLEARGQHYQYHTSTDRVVLCDEL